VAQPVFVSQSQLESWLENKEATFEGGVLSRLSEKASYELEPAVKVRSLIDGTDSRGLIGKTLSALELQAMKAEHFSGTIICGNDGYECEEGFLIVLPAGTAPPPVPAPAPSPAPRAPVAPAAAPTPAASAPVAAEPPSTAEGAATQSDSDLLAEFMLKHM
jgi:hypothetical protein